MKASLDEDFIRSHLEKKEVKKVNVKNIVNKKYNKYQKAEQGLLYYMLKDPEVIKIYNKKITYMPTSKYRFLAREISYFYKQFNYINIADLMSFLKDDPDMLKVISEIDFLDLKEDYTKEEINDYINVIYEYNVNREIEKIKEQMKKETNPLIKAELGSKIMGLRIRREEYD